MKKHHPNLRKHFQIQSAADLDFVIGQRWGIPLGMSRESPAEFRRRALAALISYRLGLKSIDYALKRYVSAETYENEKLLLGDEVSDILSGVTDALEEELKHLHTPDPAFGIFGAEITLYKIPYTLDMARMLANRGLLLEVLPILRLCLEMAAWANAAFFMHDEQKITALKAQSCITRMKAIYQSAGDIYGYLSRFTHWGHVVHGMFLDFGEEHVSVLKASVRYRAMGLALSFLLVDILVEVVRHIYAEKSEALIIRVQGTSSRDRSRKCFESLQRIAETSQLDDVWEICSFLC